MSFETVLQKIVDGCGGAIGAALMGNDGIPIVHVRADTAEPAGREAHRYALATQLSDDTRDVDSFAARVDAAGPDPQSIPRYELL